MILRRAIAVCSLLLAVSCFAKDLAEAKIAVVHEATPGAWCDDFTNTLAAARADHRPVLIVVAGSDCSFCYRLNKSMNSTDFKLWQENRNVYMVHLNDKHPQYKVAEAFVREGFKDVTSIPFVCVYWAKKDGTEVKKTFSGRRGTMPGIRHKFLQMELISALDKTLVDYTATLSRPKEILHCPDSKYFKSAMAGGSGKITMDPASGELADERGTVVITAVADDPGLVFWGWSDPRGKVVAYARKLVIDSGMMEGVYTAHYRKVTDCKAPAFAVQNDRITTRAGKKFHCRLEVDEATRPVSFRAEGMPFGLSLDAEEGVFSGTLWREGCYNITVTATGSDPAATTTVRRFQLIVTPKSSEGKTN